MSKDSKTVSNEDHELYTIAKKLGVEKSTVMFVKEHLKTNDRKTIEEHIKAHYETGTVDVPEEKEPVKEEIKKDVKPKE